MRVAALGNILLFCHGRYQNLHRFLPCGHIHILVAICKNILASDLGNLVMVVHNRTAVGPSMLTKSVTSSADNENIPRGIFGLVNNGSTCWFNSLIQVMLSLPNFIHVVRRCAAEDPVKYPVMTALGKFLSVAETAPGQFTDASSILTELMRACPGFGGRQEDAAEGLILMLDKMHPDVSRLFEATYQIDIYCDICRDVVGASKNETMVVIPMERDFTTVDTSGDPFEQYVSGHMIRINDWKCPKCSNVAGDGRAAMRIARLVKPPEILVVSFNKYDGKWGGVAYGQNIGLGYRAGMGCALYSLTGAIRHFGGRDSGHYNAMCRRPSGVWLFDDTSAQKSAFQPGDVDYMLIYNQGG